MEHQKQRLITRSSLGEQSSIHRLTDTHYAHAQAACACLHHLKDLQYFQLGTQTHLLKCVGCRQSLLRQKDEDEVQSAPSPKNVSRKENGQRQADAATPPAIRAQNLEVGLQIVRIAHIGIVCNTGLFQIWRQSKLGYDHERSPSYCIALDQNGLCSPYILRVHCCSIRLKEVLTALLRYRKIHRLRSSLSEFIFVKPTRIRLVCKLACEISFMYTSASGISSNCHDSLESLSHLEYEAQYSENSPTSSHCITNLTICSFILQRE